MFNFKMLGQGALVPSAGLGKGVEVYIVKVRSLVPKEISVLSSEKYYSQHCLSLLKGSVTQIPIPQSFV